MLNYGEIPRKWPGERVFVVGGGPSASSVDWEKLRGRRVLACNAAAFILPPGVAEVGIYGDRLFLNAFRPKLRNFVDKGAILIDASDRPIREEDHWMVHVKRKNFRNNWGISDEPSAPSWNRSTGGCAINVAVLLGAVDIVLIGFDMKASPDKKHNWHDAYDPFYRDGGKSLMKPAIHHYQENLIHPFDQIAKGLKERNIYAWNASPDSAVTQFPVVDLGKFL